VVLKDVQCDRQGCSGRVQYVVETDEEVVMVNSADKEQETGAYYQYVGEKCPVCGMYVAIGVE
jgi:hypothetical protein